LELIHPFQSLVASEISDMPTQPIFAAKLLPAFAFCLVASSACFAQGNGARPLITQPVDETKLTVLHGNTHPLARPAFDRGAAPDNLAMERMLLVLKRSPEQQAALDQLTAEQQDRSSPNYHKWLTPAEFGEQFGPTSQDVQTITSWLTSNGFQVANVSRGRTTIEFSGNAGQVRQAFHTPIHSFVVNGVQHWANANDPSIPTALTPVVAGVNTLHNFYPKPMLHVRPGSAKPTPAAARPTPDVTFTNNNQPCAFTNVTLCFFLGPTDFATIYNISPLWNAGIDGTGETIAIMNDSNINVLDVQDFRTIFGLPAKNPTVTVNGTDPGLLPNGDESEAILDVEWSGAVAKNATIDLVVSASTNTSFGGDLSATYTVNNNLAPILSESFGSCELFLGSAQNAFYNTTWQQAASQGITVIISTGDTGSAGCENSQAFDGCGVSSSSIVQPAQCGLAVSGVASTPFDIAVGGTEFNDIANPTQFWNSTSAAGTEASALSYIPEMAYNDSCTDAVVVSFFGFGSAEAACNDGVNVQPDGFVVTSGGSGGVSNCTTFDGTNPAGCTGGYPKPTWQTVLTPADGKRDLPDVSLFSGDGTISGSAYIVCERDSPALIGSGVKANTPCSLTGGIFLVDGGTSVAAQAFAGIMALVDQKNEDKQGNANKALYTLAALQSPASCNTSSPASTCVFNDVTVGTIAMPCSQGTLNCNVSTGGDLIGVLSGYNAEVGYDLATGLGSVNTANLANAPSAWASTTGGADFTLSLSPSSVTVARGSTGTVTLTVTADGGFAGTVTPTCSALPAGVTCSGATVMGSGTSTITFTASDSAMLVPTDRPARIFGMPGISATALLLCILGALSAGLTLLGCGDSKRRSGLILAGAAFALLTVSAGCGGGSSSGGGGATGPSGPTGTSNVVVTATSGTIQRSVAVTLTID
jgi:subtilase family serine protease